MKYQFTDFYPWERVLINQLRKEGKFIYSLRDGERTHYTIEENVVVDRIGYLITDELLDFKDALSDTEFMALGGTEVNDLRNTRLDITDTLNEAKTEYQSLQEKRDTQWKELMNHQENCKERMLHYKLHKRKDNPVLLDNGYRLQFQNIEKISDDKQEVRYFICNEEGKIIIDSTTIICKFNASYKSMINDIVKKEAYLNSK